jgi:hypothetical protein
LWPFYFLICAAPAAWRIFATPICILNERAAAGQFHKVDCWPAALEVLYIPTPSALGDLAVLGRDDLAACRAICLIFI